jgi:hypothetical protein
MNDFIEGINAEGKPIFEIGDEVKIIDKDKEKEIDKIENK